MAASHPEAFAAAPIRSCPHVRMNLNPGDTGHGHIAFTGIYEPELTASFCSLARVGGLLVDVGANFGYFSLLWCGLAPSNRSIAFEASPRVVPRLRDNIALNNLDPRIEVREIAVSDHAGTIRFDAGPADQTGWGGIANAEAGANLVEVPSDRLDAMISAPEIAVLKIDCEGADYLVLKGAEGLLKARKVHHIFFEENALRMQKLGIAQGSAERYVRSHGYQCASFAGGTEYHAWTY